jgi:hypothetical protein
MAKNPSTRPEMALIVNDFAGFDMEINAQLVRLICSRFFVSIWAISLMPEIDTSAP